MGKLQFHQCGYELFYGQFQRLLQSIAGYNLGCAKQQTQQRFPQIIGGFCLPVFEHAIDGVQHPTKHFAWQKPTAGCQALNSSGFHQYDRLELNHQGLVKKLPPSSDERIWNCSAQGKLANNPLYEPKVLIDKFFRTAHGALNFCLAYLTNLHGRCQNYSLNIGHQFLVFQPKVHPFGFPVGGL